MDHDKAIKWAEDRYDVAQAAFLCNATIESAGRLDAAREALFRARRRAHRDVEMVVT